MNVSDALLISLLSYGEVLAFLLLLKEQNSNLLTGRLICLSWSLYFCGTVNLLGLWINKTQRGRSAFLQDGFSDNTFSAVGSKFAVDFEFFLYRLLENITKFRVVVLGPRPMTFGVITLHKWNVSKIYLIHVYEISFLNILNIYFITVFLVISWICSLHFDFS